MRRVHSMVIPVMVAIGSFAAVFGAVRGGRFSSIPERPDVAGMTWISGGEFTRGTDARRVRVDAFWLDRAEVTNAQFAAFVAATGYVTTAERASNPQHWRHPEGPGSSILGRETRPVVQVSREDAAAYARWCGKRLPTDAEGEFAARGDSDGAERSGPVPRTQRGGSCLSRSVGFRCVRSSRWRRGS